MKTHSNKVVKALCNAALALTFSAGAVANTDSQDDASRKPIVEAQQVYKYTYKVENFAGSIAQDLELAQADIMADLVVSRDADIAASLSRSGAELHGYALFASASNAVNLSTTWDVETVTTLLPSFKARAYL